MRKIFKTVHAPHRGDKRVKKKFLLLPRQFEIDHENSEIRWLEYALIEEEYKTVMHFDAETGYMYRDEWVEVGFVNEIL